MNIELEISELFQAISELESHSFELEKEYYPITSIKIQDQNGIYQSVPFLIMKEDSILTLEFDDGSKTETALKHKMAYDRKNCKLVSEFNVGDLVEKGNGQVVKIVNKINGENIEPVYDLNIDTNDHLYQDSNGFIHHNTAHMNTVARNLGLHFIHIDVSTLNRESTTGIPTAVQAKDDAGKPLVDENGLPVMTTGFSEPELLKLIKKLMAEAVAEDDIFPESEKLKGRGKYKFLLLFDELTRADAQVFNSIRKLLLEKSFNEQYDLPAEIMVVGALNPEDDGVSELTKHTRDVVDVIPARSSWAKTESYLLSDERPNGLSEKLGFDCNSATVGAIKALLSHFQSKDLDWRGNPIAKDERLFNLLDGGNIIYISPREITDIVSTANSKILDRLTETGIKSTLSVKRDNTLLDASDDDFIAAMRAQDEEDENDRTKADSKLGIFNKSISYSDEDYEVFINAMIKELRDAWAEKLSFTTKKQDVDPANFLSVTTGFITKNNLVRDAYDTIKTMRVSGTKTIGELFGAYYDDPEELYDSPHFDNYLAANFAAPQKFVQEIQDFVADKLTEIYQGDNNSTIPYKTDKGVDLELPMVDNKKIELYLKYLDYVYVILKVLTKKAKYSGQVKEAERTGQYLSNLYMSVQSIGREFVNKHGIVKYFTDGFKNPELIDQASKKAARVKVILDEFGFARPNTK